MGLAGEFEHHGFEIMSASAEGQERWRQWYELAAKRSDEREQVGSMLQKLDARRFWQTVLMVGSTAFLVGLTLFFYNVLAG
jgi:hypothetical protein